MASQRSGGWVARRRPCSHTTRRSAHPLGRFVTSLATPPQAGWMPCRVFAWSGSEAGPCSRRSTTETSCSFSPTRFRAGAGWASSSSRRRPTALPGRLPSNGSRVAIQLTRNGFGSRATTGSRALTPGRSAQSPPPTCEVAWWRGSGGPGRRSADGALDVRARQDRRPRAQGPDRHTDKPRASVVCRVLHHLLPAPVRRPTARAAGARPVRCRCTGPLLRATPAGG